MTERRYKNEDMSGLEFRNEVVRRLNKSLYRYACNNHPDLEFFEVDEVYEMLDRVLDGIPEDDFYKDIERQESLYKKLD